MSADPASLVGTWAIERDLVDRATGEQGHFTGTLLVTATDELNELGWFESGELYWGGQTRRAERHLRITRIDCGWWMTFSDGRPFHQWVLGQEVVHPCAADTYRGLITTGPVTGSELTITWDVTGPTKNQLIVSRLVRTN